MASSFSESASNSASDSISENLSKTKLNEIKAQAQEQLALQSELASREKLLLLKLQSQSSTGVSQAQMQQTINEINTMTDARRGIQKLLLSLTQILHSQVAETRGDLVDEMTVTGVMESELNNAKQNMNSLMDVKNNKLRMVEINTYYGKRYQAHTKLMKIIIIICVPLLLLAVLSKKDKIGGDLAKTLSGIIIAIGIIVVIANVYDLSRRDNMNYDEYNFTDWGADQAANNPTVWEYDKQQLEGIKNTVESDADNLTSMSLDDLGCIGSDCCADGTSWNGADCIVGGVSSVESFQGFSASESPGANIAVAAAPFSE